MHAVQTAAVCSILNGANILPWYIESVCYWPSGNPVFWLQMESWKCFKSVLLNWMWCLFWYTVTEKRNSVSQSWHPEPHKHCMVFFCVLFSVLSFWDSLLQALIQLTQIRSTQRLLMFWIRFFFAWRPRVNYYKIRLEFPEVGVVEGLRITGAVGNQWLCCSTL